MGSPRQRKLAGDGGTSGKKKKKSPRKSEPNCATLSVRVCISFFLFFLCYVIFWPAIVDPVVIIEDPPLPLEGALSPSNGSLQDLVQPFGDDLSGAECVVFDEDGFLYAGLSNGAILKWDQKSAGYTIFARTGDKECEMRELDPECGRPSGLRIVGDKLIVADAYVGLMEIDLESGLKHTLVPQETLINGVPLNFADDVAMAPDGKYYFSDACSKWKLFESPYAALERRSNGRVLSYDPISGERAEVLTNMSFPNGVEISHDRKSLIVAETMSYKILRIHLGDRLGEVETLLENLPGIPDNIRRHPKGGYLVGLSAMRSPELDFGARYPILRKLVSKLLSLDQIVNKLGKFYALCIHFSDEGEILGSWHDPSGRLHHSSHCHIYKDKLFVGAFIGSTFGYISL